LPTDYTFIFYRERLRYLVRSIDGTVIAHNQLDVTMSLCEHAFNRGGDKFASVISWQADRDEHNHRQELQ
jgi:hypothetical protein